MNLKNQISTLDIKSEIKDMLCELITAELFNLMRVYPLSDVKVTKFVRPEEYDGRAWAEVFVNLHEKELVLVQLRPFIDKGAVISKTSNDQFTIRKTYFLYDEN